jgi:hypothetical protein
MFFRPLYITAVRSLTYIKNSFVRCYPEKRTRGKIGHEAKLWVASHPEGNFDRNQLLNGSISILPLYPAPKIDLHIRIATALHQGFPWPGLRIRIDLSRIRIRIRIQHFSNYGSGSRSQIPDPDPGFDDLKHPALQNMKILYFFYFCGSFLLFCIPYSNCGSGSRSSNSN